MILNAKGEDVDNRYLSTLVVGNYPQVCSGVLIHPHLVLTSAHCVCPPRQGQKRYDTKACMKRTEATSFRYVLKDDGWERIPQSQQGVVRPHENFEGLLDDEMSVVAVTSDLAVVFLEKPMENVSLGFQLTNSAVEIDDELAVVGYGNTSVEQKETKVRRFVGRNTVTQKRLSNPNNMKDKDIVFGFERAGAHVFEGDSGGPCFREDQQDRWLVGIISMGNGKVSQFTSLHPHLLWLKDQIAKAEQLADQYKKRKPL